MRRILSLAVLASILVSSHAWACGGYPALPLNQALSNNPEEAAKAAQQMRAMGPTALAQVAAKRDRRQDQLANATPEQAEALRAEIAKLNQLMDEIGGARYCSVSRLYWYTDFEEAKAEAARTNKPILSLRMLGKLDEEFSCANSRFFRTTLYANQEISETLRDKFVLHWESVRPVPKITIDFGDGRKLERTLTGNSIHYVVDASGRPLDGLPGLHGPQAFAQWLARVEALAQSYAAQAPAGREELLRSYHRARISAIKAAFAKDLSAITGVYAQQAYPASAVSSDSPALPNSIDDLPELTWQQIARLHADDATLDKASVQLIRDENPSAVLAGMLAVSKRAVEDPITRLVRTFQSSTALDTVRNEYVLHRRLHEWYAGGAAEADLRDLNERIYAVLFLTPSSDPWLGLVPPNTYTGLTNGGLKSDFPPDAR